MIPLTELSSKTEVNSVMTGRVRVHWDTAQSNQTIYDYNESTSMTTCSFSKYKVIVLG